MLNQLIKKLGQELDMAEMITSSDINHYSLPFDGDFEIEASQEESNILLKGVIEQCPQQNVGPFLCRLMEANLFGIGTRGAAIGLNEDGNVLTLSLELDYNSSYQEFKEKLEDFISVMDFWRKEALEHH